MPSFAQSPAHAEFAARIARIESGQGSSKRTLYVGVEDSFQIPERRVVAAPPPRRAGLGVVLALMIGGLSVEASLLARDQIVALIGPAPTAAMQVLQLVCIGVLVAMIVSRLLGLRARAHTLALVLGAAIGGVALIAQPVSALNLALLQDLQAQYLPPSLGLGNLNLPF